MKNNNLLSSAQREIKKFNYEQLLEEPQTVYEQLLMNHQKFKPAIKQFKDIQPLKLLDAPNVTPESEYQLLDWSFQEIVCLGLKENLFVRNFKTGTTQLLSQLEDGIFTSLCQQEELIAYSTSNGQVIIADCELKQQLQCYQINDIIRTCTFQGNILCCASINSGILYFDLRQNKYVYRIGTMSDVFTVSLDDYLLATGSNNKVNIWDIRNPSILIASYNQDGRALTWDKRKKHYLCAGGKDQKITIWSSEGEYNPSYIYVDGQVTQISSSSHQIVYCSGNRCYNGSTSIMNRHSDKVLRISLSPDYTQLCSLGADELLIFWQLE